MKYPNERAYDAEIGAAISLESLPYQVARIVDPEDAEFVNRQVPTLVNTLVWGGVANTFNDNIYVSRIGGSTVRCNFGVGGVGIANLDKTGWNFAAGARVKFAIAWAANDMAFVVDGAAAITSASLAPSR